MTPASAPGPSSGARLAGPAIGGALLGVVASAAFGFALDALRLHVAAGTWRGFLAAGGWLQVPLGCAALGLVVALPGAPSARRGVPLGLALALAVLAALLRPVVPLEREGPPPVTQRAKLQAFRRWSYRSPNQVARLLPFAHDRDPLVREQAALMLGLNTVVTDIEHATPGNPARYLRHPLRDSLRVALSALLCDSSEAVRGEAARALWKAPLAFGPEPAAAETLAAILERARRAVAVERLVWLALDAAAATPDSSLKAAAAAFAASCPDTALARTARHASLWPGPPR